MSVTLAKVPAAKNNKKKLLVGGIVAKNDAKVLRSKLPDKLKKTHFL